MQFMEFKDIVSVSGLPGLFEMVSSKGDGIIVKSLLDGKSQFVSSRVQGVSALDTISLFLKNEESTALKKVMQEMKKQEAAIPLPDLKKEEDLKAYLKKIVPDYDEEKVHLSDMKKLVKWYSILKEKNLIPEEEKEKENKDESVAK